MRPWYSILFWPVCFVLGMCGPSFADTFPPSNQIQIEDVGVAMSDRGPVILLKARNRFVPIFVDPTVAGSIEAVLQGKKFPRPLSHDLMHTILQAYGGMVKEVRISLKNQIYFGKLTVSIKGERQVFDSRSSDAIALAIHFDAPIYVEKKVFDQAEKPLSESEEIQQL